MSDLKFGTWSAAASPLTIEYSVVVVEEVRHEVAEGFQKLSRGGIEVGGLLYGVHEGQTVRIMAIRPAVCEHAAGPSFRLSERDRAALQEQIRHSPDDERLEGLVCVGWYVSHTRTEIALTESDREIFSSHFSQPWQVTLVVRPNRGGNMRAGFFVWEPDGTVNASQSYLEFSFPDRLGAVFDHRPEHRPTLAERDRERQAPQRRPIPRASNPPPVQPQDTDLSPKTPVPTFSTPTSIGMTTLFGQPLDPISEPGDSAKPGRSKTDLSTTDLATQDLDTTDLPKQSSAKKWLVLVAALIVIAALAAGGARFLAFGKPGETIALSVLEREGQLDIEWNRAAAPVSKAAGGTIEIADGPQTRTIPLKPADLALGKFSYKRDTGDIQVRMMVEGPDGKKVQEASRFLGPPPAHANSGEVEALQKRRDELEAEVNRLKESNDQQTQRIQQLERTLKILQTRPGVAP